MIKDECKHEWKKHTNASRQVDVGEIPAHFRCEKCRTQMTASEVFQLEALENQNKTLRHLKGFQRNITIVMAVIAILSLIVAIFK